MQKAELCPAVLAASLCPLWKSQHHPGPGSITCACSACIHGDFSAPLPVLSQPGWVHTPVVGWQVDMSR